MSKYDPQKHHRRSIRLKGWDYRRPGYYFVNIDLENRECLFGRVKNQKMILNDYGKICNECWLAIPDHFENVKLDTYQIMPNHVHGIIVITKWIDGKVKTKKDATDNEVANNDMTNVRATNNGADDERRGDACVAPTPPENPPRGPEPGSLGAIVGSFKSAVSGQINKLRQTPGLNYGNVIITNGLSEIIPN